jgi:hypothetical protein
MAFFYANENFPIGVVERLREKGRDVLTSQAAGNANQRIPDIYRFLMHFIYVPCTIRTSLRHMLVGWVADSKPA